MATFSPWRLILTPSSYLKCVFIYTLLALQSSYAAHNDLPELGDSTSGYVSQSQEHLLGRAWLRQLRAQANTINDPLTISFVEELIYRLAPHSEVKDNRFEFVVIDQGELNAFAVPGGIIGINAGIFLYSDDEDEISGVLAHELAHLSQRHFARQIENAERQSPIAIASLLASILLIATNNADAGFAGLVGSQAASAQSQLSYSRDWEREADRSGMKTLAGSGLDPFAMPSMFQHMLAANRYNERPPEFLLTHPVTDSRISDAANRAEAYPSQTRTRSFNFLILQERSRIFYRLPSSEQLPYFANALAKTNDQKERDSYRYTQAWIYNQRREYQQSLSFINKISMLNQDQPAVSILKAESLSHLGQGSKAIELLESAYSLRPDNYPIAISLAEIKTNNGQAKGAISDIERWSERRGTDPIIWKQVSDTAHKADNLILAYRARAEYFFLYGQKNNAMRQLQKAIDLADKQSDFQQKAGLRQRLIQMSESQESLSL
jgi:predicted Zn-dependent protease